MRRTTQIAIISILALIGSNVYYYLDTFKWQIQTQENILKKELRVCYNQIDQNLNRTQTNLILLITHQELDSLFEERFHTLEFHRRMQMLYNRYAEYLQSLKIVRISDGSSYLLKRNKNASYTYLFGKSEIRSAFNHNQIIDAKGETLTYVQPLFDDLKIFGYVEMEFRVDDFFRSSFYSFSLGDLQFQWVLKYNGTVLYNTLEQKAFYPEIDSRELINTDSGIFSRIHTINIEDEQVKVLSLFLRSKMSQPGYFLVFSLPLKILNGSIVHNAFGVGVISLLIILIILAFYGLTLRNQQKKELRLQQSEQALNKMLLYLPVGILLVDQEREVKIINKAAKQLFYIEDEDQILGQTLDEKRLLSNYEIISATSYSSYDNRYVLKDREGKEHVVSNEKIPFFLQNERYFIDFYHEITPFLSTDTKPQLTPQSEFIANISHELRTPLNGIIGMNELLVNSPKLPKEEREMAKVARRSAETLLALINDILDFSKIEAGKFEIESIPFNLHDEVVSTVQSFTQIARAKKITLTWSSSTRLPYDFMGDPIRIRQVFNNLIGNALKFTPGGRIHISIQQSRMLNGNKALLFSVKDTGIGIKKEKLATIFKPFSQADQTTTRKFGGTGLGTTISKQLVNLMGGEIWVTSPSGISENPEYPGTEFSFTLPYKTRKFFKELHLERILSFSQLQTLVVSDDPLQVQVIAKNLKSLSINFKILPPSRETLNLLRDTAQYQFLIIDHRPDLNGLDFLLELYSYHLHKKYLIAIQSNDYQVSNTKVARQLGADIYLRKPVSAQVLKNFLLRHFTAIETVESSNPSSIPEGLNILVMEESPLERQIIKNIFHRLGYSIDLANHANEAIEMSQDTPYDLILLNFNPMGTDIIELGKTLRSHDYKNPIVLLTSNSEEELQLNAMKGIIDDCLIKPVGMDNTLRMILKWCNHPSGEGKNSGHSHNP